MCRVRRSSDIRGVDKDYEAHTAANKNGFRGRGETENRDIVHRREFLEDAPWENERKHSWVNDKCRAYNVQFHVIFYPNLFLLLCNKLKISLLFILFECEEESMTWITMMEKTWVIMKAV